MIVLNTTKATKDGDLVLVKYTDAGEHSWVEFLLIDLDDLPLGLTWISRISKVFDGVHASIVGSPSAKDVKGVIHDG